MTESRIFEPDGRAIVFAAEGAGPNLVLVADRGAGIESLAALAHSVSTEDFQVVRVATAEAQDVIDLLDELEIADAWIGGHGAGGSVARAVALEQHDRVNGLLLLGVEADAPALATGLPVLVVQSSDDDVTPPANGEALRDGAPAQVSVVTIEGGGHRFPATRIGETSWAIEDYLDWD
ncbi:MAG: alpha/beta hydrolase [Herbiconiux sp.]|uniref:alpha/beta fold hydrolase n=1 Tax=Herbiconiux sp. TaxID=1871186 RepID=UPI0012246E92|nr:alpha/beta hydrolase [Herbiconiux sp.]TAJ46238.1 MAG: alpha/beta hydrolase [Herbiconiux sp.]